MHYAVYHDDSELIQLLIEHGAELNTVDNNDVIPLFFSEYEESYAIARLVRAKRVINEGPGRESANLYAEIKGEAAGWLHKSNFLGRSVAF